MKLVLKLYEIDDSCKGLVGGKAAAVARMAGNGLTVPRSICVTTSVFDMFMQVRGLYEKILMEYSRKQFEDMRWEEMWDASLRIRNMFLNTPFPEEIRLQLASALESFFGEKAVVVRSSAIGEDSKKTSFAGIHDSFVNIKGVDSILKHIKLVWASLFSDAAILYRKEIGLDVNSSKMAVLVQEFVNGQKSGVAFGESPASGCNMIIEAVYGLNQGLVDGTVEPDRWILSRQDGHVISYKPSKKNKIMIAEETGVSVLEISGVPADKPLLTGREILGVYELCKKVESIFGVVQDYEWSYLKRTLYSLQSRPITTQCFYDKDQNRQWFLSLKRSYQDLELLGEEINQRLIPEMKKTASYMAGVKLSCMSNDELAGELSKRKKNFDKWRDIYWDKFIPFAHAVRLFGEVYNKQVMPDDPYEFTYLLVSTDMKSLERNKMLQRLGKLYESKMMTGKSGKSNAVNEKFEKLAAEFVDKYQNSAWGHNASADYKDAVIELIKRVSESGFKRPKGLHQKYRILKERYLESFTEKQRSYAEELLELARISYQLRDDDNIYLGRIEEQLARAIRESKKRLEIDISDSSKSLNVEEAVIALKRPGYVPKLQSIAGFKGRSYELRPRQLVGQPACKGLAVNRARVIKKYQDIFDFRKGEILVCDAIDPNMTFIVPFASGIVERRGGMLIHGAIIAREYGLACVTGVPDAVESIETGQEIIVDGYLGIVTIKQP